MVHRQTCWTEQMKVSLIKIFTHLGQVDKMFWIEKMFWSINSEDLSSIQEEQNIPLACVKFRVSYSQCSKTANTPRGH